MVVLYFVCVCVYVVVVCVHVCVHVCVCLWDRILFIKDIKLLGSIYIIIQFNEIVKQTRNDIHLCWKINNMNRQIILQNISCKIIMS